MPHRGAFHVRALRVPFTHGLAVLIPSFPIRTLHMKRTVFAIVIIIVMLASGIAEQVYLHHLFSDLHTKAEAISLSVAEDDLARALEETSSLQTWWEARKHFLEAIVSHNETKEVTLRIAELRGYIAISDRKSAYATAAILLETSTNLPHLLGFSWDTVC